jgi:ABC-type arginine transport system ATPase subunit
MHTITSNEPGVERAAGISCRSIYKAFNETKVLRSVGAGESVAVYCRRELIDRKVRWGPSAGRLRLIMGMLFQHFTLFDHMTTIENRVLAHARCAAYHLALA